MNLPLRDTPSATSAIAIQSVYEVTKLLASSPRPRERFSDVLTLLADFLEFRDVCIALQNEAVELEVFGLRAAPRQSAGRRSRLARAAFARVHATGMPWVVESEWCEPALEGAVAEHPELGELEASFVAVPIKDRGRVLGVLYIERAHGPGDQACFCFDADVRVLTVIANAVLQASRIIAAPRTAPVASDTPSRASASPEAVRRSTSPPRVPPPEAKGGISSSVAGSSARWRATLERARIAARTSATILLRGESGTGKEVLARYVHEHSPRADRPFVSVNCAALAEGVLESELFGHEKGAFTGATAQRKGRFELADGGTLFLDEIGEISRAFQAGLLRVLQLGEFERVGGMNTLKVDVRVVAATHRNLEEDVRSGRFRADLYYRLSVVPLLVPALRERRADIADLAREFLSRFNQANETELSLDASALEELERYPFPGNVRELENIVRRAASFAQSPRLTASDFAWLQHETPLTLALRHSPESSAEEAELPPYSGREIPRERLIAALDQAGWVQAKAARLLGLTPRQVGYALQKYQIPVRKF